jgi:hypothetical protein
MAGSTPATSQYSLILLGTYIYPQGAFRNVTDKGYGIKAKPEINGALFNNSTFQLSASHYSYKNNNDSFNSFNSVELILLAGYSLKLQRFSINPLAGAGYNINILHDADGKKKKLYDPHVTGCVDIKYMIFNDLNIVISPAYTLFFEKDNNGRYFGISAGIGLIF